MRPYKPIKASRTNSYRSRDMELIKTRQLDGNITRGKSPRKVPKLQLKSPIKATAKKLSQTPRALDPQLSMRINFNSQSPPPFSPSRRK